MNFIGYIMLVCTSVIFCLHLKVSIHFYFFSFAARFYFSTLKYGPLSFSNCAHRNLDEEKYMFTYSEPFLGINEKYSLG